MADVKHLRIFRLGVKAWNEWREKNPEVYPNLTNENFEGAKLNNINLSHTDLSDSNLYDANLNNANLNDTTFQSAFLRNADLSYSDLSDSDLTDADARGADLYCINLRSTFLYNTNLSFSDMYGANLEGARFGHTILGGVDLTDAIGLESCIHDFPSIVDHETLANSGKLPLSFLRGCGLPDTLIEYVPSLLDDPIQFYSCFISYSSKNQQFAERLHADLQDKGVRCWFAPEDLKIGDRIRPRIDESIRLHDKLLLVLSEDSVSSQWVEQEVETALAREREQERTVLFPIRLDDTVLNISYGWPALIRNTRNIGDFREWKEHAKYQKALERLLRDLKAEGQLKPTPNNSFNPTPR